MECVFNIYTVCSIIFGIFLSAAAQKANVTLSAQQSVAYVGQSLTLTCSFVVNVTLRQAWIAMTSNGHGIVTYLYDENGCKQEDISNGKYAVKCESVDHTIHVMIPAQNMSLYEDGSVWACYTVYQDDNRQTFRVESNEIIVNVTEPVETVTFTLPSDNPVTIATGETKIFTCQTSRCRPPARIEWYMDNVNITSEAEDTIHRQQGYRFVSVGSLIVRRFNGNQLSYIQCKAMNTYGREPVFSTKKLIVPKVQQILMDGVALKAVQSDDVDKDMPMVTTEMAFDIVVTAMLLLAIVLTSVTFFRLGILRRTSRAPILALAVLCIWANKKEKEQMRKVVTQVEIESGKTTAIDGETSSAMDRSNPFEDISMK